MARKALGRGLEALLPSGEEIREIPISEIHHSSLQPRREIKNLDELVRSIKEKGILQPVLLRKSKEGYELVYGHRRFEAAKLAGLEKIPAVIRELSDREVLELAIIENVQREDLNPIEEALAYKKLIQEFGLTQEEIAQRVGKDRSTIANKLRLLSLPEEAKKALMEGKITEGHARALLGIKSEEKRKKVLQEILTGKKTVREVERKAKARDPHIKALEDELSSYLGTKVRIVKGRKKGKIEIEFYSLDELDRLLELIKGEER